MQNFLVLCVASCLVLQSACTGQFPSLRRHAHQHHAAAQAAPEEPLDTTVPSAPVEVPTALSGELPSVSDVFGGASQSLKSITSEVSSIGSLAPSRLMQLKAKFEKKLKLQEDVNRAAVQANSAVQANITSLTAANEDLRKTAKSLEEKNALMRQELSATGSRLGAVNQYISAALHASDDSQASSLVVLGGAHRSVQKPPHKKLQPKIFAEVGDYVDEEATTQRTQEETRKADDDDDDGQDQGLAFVALSSKHSRATSPDSVEPSTVVEANDTDSTQAAAPTVDADPQKVLAALAKRVSELTKQENSEEAKYTALYKKDAKAGEKRHKALLTQERQLIAKRQELNATHQKLTAACAHLQKTTIDLESKLRGLGLFAQKISHLMMAPDGEAAELLSALPKQVSPAKAALAAP